MFTNKTNLEVKIVDFGLAEFVNDPEVLFKRSGTPGYVGPEILKDRHYDT
jgi:serine/threonine protein kinase